MRLLRLLQQSSPRPQRRRRAPHRLPLPPCRAGSGYGGFGTCTRNTASIVANATSGTHCAGAKRAFLRSRTWSAHRTSACSGAGTLPVTGSPIRRRPFLPGNPNALGVARVVEIDTTGGARFGFESPYDFLREGEVVLTFDDGPWPDRTPAVLKALAAHCTKAIFFPIGVHATYHPGFSRR